tara:strand:+ start:473 stop:1924 length:1452 start_codon:yes stop_codon:yes gene_type:complete
MAEIKNLNTLAKASATSNDVLLVTNTSTNAATKYVLTNLFPVIANSGAGEQLYVNLTNKNQFNFKGIKSGTVNSLLVTTASNDISISVIERGIDLSKCNNANAQFSKGVDFTKIVSGTNLVRNGGTGLSSISKGGVLYASDSDTLGAHVMGTNGQLLIGNTTNGYPSVSTLTAGTNITITNGAGSISIAASLASLAANLDTGSYNIDLNTNYISDDGSDRGIYVHTNGKTILNDSGSSLTTGDATGQLNIQGTTTTAIKIGNSGAYQSNYSITTTTASSGTAGAGLNIYAAAGGGGNDAGGALKLYGGTAVGSGAGGHVIVEAGKSPSGTDGSVKLNTFAGATSTTALTVDQTQDVTVNTGSLIITGATEGIVHTNSGTVTQATNHTTGVTLNTTSGVIQLAAVALAAATNAEFTLTNSTIQADSVILLTIQDENTTNNAQLTVATHTIAGGSCKISIHNPAATGATSTTASKIHFLIINNSV